LPSPRGIPQIEVTFDIDANGIVNVSAKDKATSKAQQITITASSGLSESEVARMTKEAQEHEVEDKKRREAIEARNSLESLQFSVQKHFDENKDKIPTAERGALEEALKEARATLDAHKEANEAEIFKTSFEKLEKASHKMAEALYKAAGGTEGAQASAGGTPPADGNGAGAGAGKKDDVIDAEYTETPKN
jgi:molecular chaperone DnaK